jgi:GAF domain-containing protein
MSGSSELRILDEWNAILRQMTWTAGRGSVVARSLLEARVVHIADITADPEYAVPEAITIGNIRTLLGVPLLREGEPVGVFAFGRRRVEPFTERQIGLVRTFADQAVIAMENARLLTETREALEQQTATAEVLQVINSSPGDLGPVFDAMLEKATSLCEAAYGILRTYDGQCFHPSAIRSDPQFAEWLRARSPFLPSPGSPFDLIVRGERFVGIADTEIDGIYHSSPGFRELAEIAGIRSHLVVGLRKEETLIGALAIYRKEVDPFADRQVALLQNFAAQAVIAMENARLINETREALEQQTATAEVLQVINSSPGDLAPVFDAMLEKAHSLCGADNGSLLTYDGERFWPMAWHGLSTQFADARSEGIDPGVAPSFGRIVRGEHLDHIRDMVDFAAQFADDATRRRLSTLVETEGIRTQLIVALRKDDLLLGAITANRSVVRPFSDKQIALLENFAAQAVIAMENARLLTETREALEQQTATAEVLQVINSSPGDLAPVFDAILEKAHSLCGAAHGVLVIREGEGFRTVAANGVEPAFVQAMRQLGPMRPPDGSGPARLILGEQIVHIADYQAESFLENAPPQLRRVAEIGGIRTVVMVPLRKDDAVIGIITAFRQEVRPFSDKQIALLQNFAAQAVIAMENARLLTETREALEQQTATAEVLQVINSSPGDLEPVFEAMLEKATRLCEAPFSTLRTWDGERFHFGAVYGDPQLSDWVRRRGSFHPDGGRSPSGELWKVNR